jgi:glyoxylate reductase
MTGLVDEELASHYPDSLKYICHNGAGYDQVDVPACTKRGVNRKRSRLTLGIKVSNTPGAVVAATADVGIFLLIGAIRNFNHGLMELRRGNWKNNVARGHDPEGKIMGVLGMGDIGQVISSSPSKLTARQWHFEQSHLA